MSRRCLAYISESLVLTKALHLQRHAFAQLFLFNQNQVVSLLSTLINPSISAPNHLSIFSAHGDFFFFLTQCSVWFSILTKDGIRMMDVYLPAVWSPVLFLTAYRHHHHHRHILLIACSRSLIISPTGKKKKSPVSFWGVFYALS